MIKEYLQPEIEINRFLTELLRSMINPEYLKRPSADVLIGQISEFLKGHEITSMNKEEYIGSFTNNPFVYKAETGDVDMN